jgi:ADP-heptose:LPS heptosyltransferase
MMAMPAGTALPEVRKIAVLRPNAVGDFVFTLPALHALKATYPEAEIVYLGKAWHADFLLGRPGPIDRVVVVPPYPGVGMPADAPHQAELEEAFFAAMRAEAFDLALQLYGGGRYSNPFTQKLGARVSLGMRAPDAPPLDMWVAYAPLQNRRMQMLEVAALAGARALALQPELEVTARDRREAAQVLPADAQQALVIIQPGASDPRRRWPAERFAAVADLLASQGALIAIHGTAEEAALVRRVMAAMHHPAIDLSGRVSLCGLCGLLERAALLVSNDTGPLHLAVAIGTPCVGIYWLSNLVESCPLQQHMHRAAMSVRTHCPQCGAENFRSGCPHSPSFVDDVELDEVSALAMGLFAEQQHRCVARAHADRRADNRAACAPPLADLPYAAPPLVSPPAASSFRPGPRHAAQPRGQY